MHQKLGLGRLTIGDLKLTCLSIYADVSINLVGLLGIFLCDYGVAVHTAGCCPLGEGSIPISVDFLKLDCNCSIDTAHLWNICWCVPMTPFVAKGVMTR